MKWAFWDTRRGGFEIYPASARARFDITLLLVILGLILFGVVIVYSATSPLAGSPRFPNISHDYFLQRHLIFVVVGFTAALITIFIPTRLLERVKWYVLFGIAVSLLVLVLVPNIGYEVNGARRWIRLGPLNVQICEIVKLLSLIIAAQYASTHQYFMHSFYKLFPLFTYTIVVMVLLGFQPDLGSAFVCGLIIGGMLFLAGLSYRILMPLGVLTVAGVVAGVVLSPWRLLRLMAYLNPWDPEYVMGKGYQLGHSMVAFSRGQVTGLGLGGSVEKLNYLPEAHTDFILSIVGEELGFVGIVVVITAFYFVIRRCFEIGRRAIRLERFFPGMLAQGVGIWVGVQTVINVGVACGLFPTKGLTLPFLSYGGSSLVVMCCAMALVLRVDYENRRLMFGGH